MESRGGGVEREARGRGPALRIAGFLAVIAVMAGIAHWLGVFEPGVSEAKAEGVGPLVGSAAGADARRDPGADERESPRLQSAEYDASREAAVGNTDVVGVALERDRLRIRGRVLSALGRAPVELGNVSYRRYLEATATEPERLEIRRALCDDTGAFELEVAPPLPKNFQLRAEAPGFGAVDAIFSLKEWRNPTPTRMEVIKRDVRLHGQPDVRLEDADSTAGGSDLLLVSAGVTDAEGRFELLGSVTDYHVLRVAAEGHLEIIVGDVRCGEGMSPLVLTLNPGAGLSGRLGPIAALPQLGLAPRDDFPGQARFNAEAPPQVTASLRAAGGGRRDVATATVQDDGSFQLQGLPAGRYDLRLFIHDYRLETNGPGLTHVGIGLAEDLALEEGPVRTMEWDLAPLIPAPVRGRILWDGKPLARARVTCFGKAQALVGSPPWILSPGLVTDDEGRFETRLWPGTYRLLIAGTTTVAPATGGVEIVGTTWRDTQPFDVRSGQETRVDRPLSSLALEVRVSDKEGRPRQGYMVSILDRVGDSVGNGPRAETDAEGRVRFERLLAGPKQITTAPKEEPTKAKIHDLGDLRPPRQSLTLVHED